MNLPRVYCITSRPHCNTCGREARPDEVRVIEPDLYELPHWRETQFGKDPNATLLQCTSCLAVIKLKEAPRVEFDPKLTPAYEPPHHIRNRRPS